MKRLLFLVISAVVISCSDQSSLPDQETIAQLQLKTGSIISCGPPAKEFGTVNFDISGDATLQEDFNMAVELLHSFEYDEAEKQFAKILQTSPGCVMAYWGVAMCNFHPLWEPPTEPDLVKGAKAIAIAQTIKKKTRKEEGYLNAVAAYYNDWENTHPRARSQAFEKAMEALHGEFPDDNEIAIFYALSLDASADPADRSYKNQLKAGNILNALYKKEPNHPGIIHYIIHNYDYPVIATHALEAARRYASVAPSSAHALHMPSHIFTRLGLWDDCILSNRHSVEAAECYAGSAGIKGHWDEELHGIDYLVYAYLQKGNNKAAQELKEYLSGDPLAYPMNLKVAYAFAALSSRIALENKDWTAAEKLTPEPVSFPWQKFPWQEAIVHFSKLLGKAHLHKPGEAKTEWEKLKALHDKLLEQKENYRANQVAIQLKAGEAWIRWAEGQTEEALQLMNAAAEMEDGTSKHPVTPGEVVPARELLADMQAGIQQYDEALKNYEAVQEKSPNRFNCLYGAAITAEKAGDTDKAIRFYKQLLAIADPGSPRPELEMAAAFVRKKS